MTTYNDLTLISFGDYKGTPLQDIPASYFNWLWNNGMSENKTNPMHEYIKSSMDALKQEYPDGIWNRAK